MAYWRKHLLPNWFGWLKLIFLLVVSRPVRINWFNWIPWGIARDSQSVRLSLPVCPTRPCPSDLLWHHQWSVDYSWMCGCADFVLLSYSVVVVDTLIMLNELSSLWSSSVSWNLLLHCSRIWKQPFDPEPVHVCTAQIINSSQKYHSVYGTLLIFGLRCFAGTILYHLTK